MVEPIAAQTCIVLHGHWALWMGNETLAIDETMSACMMCVEVACVHEIRCGTSTLVLPADRKAKMISGLGVFNSYWTQSAQTLMGQV